MKRPEAPDLRAVLKALTSEFTQAGIESPGVEAERLVAHVMGIERPQLAMEARSCLTAEAAVRLGRLIERRLGGEPLQHLEGSTEFRDLVLRSDSRALIPRPETEQLVGLVQRWVRDRAGTPAAVRTVRRPGSTSDVEPVSSALDIGTGSGAIALSLAAEGLARRVVGVDSSLEALEQAHENRAAAGVSDLVEFRHVASDPFEALQREESFALIVSNPPYITDDEMEFEPVQALRGGQDGLDLVRVIAASAHEHLEESGGLFLEVGAEQTGAVSDLLGASGRWTQITVQRDLAGRLRFVTAVRA
jgi:release factor glutamine methyltransferase